MIEKDENIERYKSLNPSLYSVLDQLELYQKGTGRAPASMLSMEIWFRLSVNEGDDPRRLHLSFFDVNDLKVNAQGFVQVPLLEIVSIKEYQWENLKYRVEDAEGNQLSFYCKKFTANIEERENMIGDGYPSDN